MSISVLDRPTRKLTDRDIELKTVLELLESAPDENFRVKIIEEALAKRRQKEAEAREAASALELEERSQKVERYSDCDHSRELSEMCNRLRGFALAVEGLSEHLDDDGNFKGIWQLAEDLCEKLAEISDRFETEQERRRVDRE
jgi:hypothetical protein